MDWGWGVEGHSSQEVPPVHVQDVVGSTIPFAPRLWLFQPHFSLLRWISHSFPLPPALLSFCQLPKSRRGILESFRSWQNLGMEILESSRSQQSWGWRFWHP